MKTDLKLPAVAVVKAVASFRRRLIQTNPEVILDETKKDDQNDMLEASDAAIPVGGRESSEDKDIKEEVSPQLKEKLDHPPDSLPYFQKPELQKTSAKDLARQRWKILCLVRTSDTVADETARQEKLKARC